MKAAFSWSLIFFVSLISFAYIDLQKQNIYTTKWGKNYHNAGCASLSKRSFPVSPKDAVCRGFAPCLRCKPHIQTVTKTEPGGSAKVFGTGNVSRGEQDIKWVGSAYMGISLLGEFHRFYY